MCSATDAAELFFLIHPSRGRHRLRMYCSWLRCFSFWRERKSPEVYSLSKFYSHVKWVQEKLAFSLCVASPIARRVRTLRFPLTVTELALFLPGEKKVQARAVFYPLTGKGDVVNMCYRTLYIGTGKTLLILLLRYTVYFVSVGFCH